MCRGFHSHTYMYVRYRSRRAVECTTRVRRNTTSATTNTKFRMYRSAGERWSVLRACGVSNTTSVIASSATTNTRSS